MRSILEIYSPCQVCAMLNSGQATRHWHPEHKVPNIVSGDQWIGYDDPQSLQLKVGGNQTINRPVSQIPQCIRQISHNEPFCNKCAHITTHLLAIEIRALIGQSYMTCLKCVTLKHGNVNFRQDVRLEFVPWICYSSAFFHNFVVRIESRCVIKAKHVLLLY